MEIPEKPDPKLRKLPAAPAAVAKCLGCRFISSICKLRSPLLPAVDNEDIPVRMLLADPRFIIRRETNLSSCGDVSDTSICKSRSFPLLPFDDEDEPVCKLLTDPRFGSRRDTNDMSSCGGDISDSPDSPDSPETPVMMLL
mmetsp:Transcript_474/g.1054  ORF Transcript_474/g.1054 Transcript_474/m.1054 type:complete len:141 (+) Transcript_474:61-483(+)